MSRSVVLWSIPGITFSLGIWQLFRLEWKNNLIEKSKKNQKTDFKTLLKSKEIGNLEYSLLELKGKFIHEKYVENTWKWPLSCLSCPLLSLLSLSCLSCLSPVSLVSAIFLLISI